MDYSETQHALSFFSQHLVLRQSGVAPQTSECQPILPKSTGLANFCLTCMVTISCILTCKLFLYRKTRLSPTEFLQNFYSMEYHFFFSEKNCAFILAYIRFSEQTQKQTFSDFYMIIFPQGSIHATKAKRVPFWLPMGCYISINFFFSQYALPYQTILFE